MALRNLTTPWTDTVGEQPLPEYPRPQFRRKSYLNLNGKWKYAITKNDVTPSVYDGDILVPFSPESMLSGVNRRLKPKQFLWYHRTFTLPVGFNKGIALLHFGAVDQICDVYVKG